MKTKKAKMSVKKKTTAPTVASKAAPRAKRGEGRLEKPKRIRKPPSAEATQRKNANKRDAYKEGRFDVVPVYFDSATFSAMESARALKGESRSGFIKGLVKKSLKTKNTIDKPTRSSQSKATKPTRKKKTSSVAKKSRNKSAVSVD